MLIDFSIGTSVAGVSLVSTQPHGRGTSTTGQRATHAKPGAKASIGRREAPRTTSRNDRQHDRLADSIIRLTGTAAQAQKGIVTYGLAPNRQNPFAGAAHAAIFNTWRRASAQILYVVPPFVAAYYIMNWATER